jgi:hypothetical protein
MMNVISVSVGYMMPGPSAFRVVRRERHQLPGGGCLEIRERELLDVREEIVPDVELDVPGDDDDRLAGQEREYARDERKADDEECIGEDPAFVEDACLESVLQLVDGPAHEKGKSNIEDVAQHDGQ